MPEIVDYVECSPEADLEREWLELLAQLWTAIGKPVDPKRLRIYRDRLGFVPYGLLDQAIGHILTKRARYQNVPMIGDVIAEVSAMLGKPVDLGVAISQWQHATLRACVYDGT